MIIDALHGSPNIKPPMWAIDLGIIAHNASGMGLLMPDGLLMWGSGKLWPDLVYTGDASITATDRVWLENGFNITSNNYADASLHKARNTITDFTLFVVTKPRTTGTYRGLISWSASVDKTGYGIIVSAASDRYYFFMRNASGTGNTISTGAGSLIAGQVANITVVSQEGNSYLYLDGVLKNSVANNWDVDTNDGVRIGRYYIDFTTLPWDGIIYAIITFPTAFTPYQVATISADPYGLVRQPSMEALWTYYEAVVGVAPTGVLYGPLFGPLGGPV